MPLNFKQLEHSTRIEWVDGAILIFTRPEELKIPDKELSASSFGKLYVSQYLTGWEEINDGDSGKPLKYNDENKNHVVDWIVQDPKIAEKLKTFIGGTLGNSNAGSSVS